MTLYKKRGMLRVVAEDAYNDGTSVPAANTKYWPPGSKFNSYKRAMGDRRSVTPNISGARPTRRNVMGMYEHEVIVDHLSLDGTTNVDNSASLAGVPEWLVWSLGGGWYWTYAETGEYSGLVPPGVTLAPGANDRILTGVFRPRTSAALSSLRLTAEFFEESLNEAIIHDLKGARHGGTLELVDGETLKYIISGKSLATKPAKNASPSINTLKAEQEVVAQGGATSWTKVEATARTYGKVSETTQSLGQLAIRNLKIDLGPEAKERTGTDGGGGVVGIRYSTKTPIATFQIDMVTWDDDFDIYTFQDERKILRYVVVIAHPEDSNSFFLLTFEGYIFDLEPEESDDHMAMNVTMILGFPDNSNDGGGLVSTTLLTVQHVTIVSP